MTVLHRSKGPASASLFPPPYRVRHRPGVLANLTALSLHGVPPPAWLRRRLAAACAAAGIRFGPGADRTVETRISEREFTAIADSRCRAQAYRLTIDSRGDMTVVSPSPDGLGFGLLTLAHLLEARGAGARLAPLVIDDHPAFAVRGLQIDMAREYLPSVGMLRGLIDRAVDLKCNTIWLYLENRFRAPELEDLSPPGGITPAQARALSAYAADRGIDLVPATNVLSHMEGWLRLERYAGFADGQQLSYPVLTDPRVWPLVRRYLDALAEAFPSPNFHAGLDELLFVGTHPDAAAAIAKLGKPRYFSDFAVKVIRHLQRVHGKTVWMWDDMVLGKNVYRREGFNDAYREALDRIPRDVVMSHWYYWTDNDGLHGPIIKRVADSGRPFVVVPATLAFSEEVGRISAAWVVQSYMAGCGKRHGAFGLVNTHWESRYGHVFMTAWPLLAMGAGFAWCGDMRLTDPVLSAFGFRLCGGNPAAFTAFMRTIEAIQDLLIRHGVGPGEWRGRLFLEGPQVLWRLTTAGLTSPVRRRLRGLLAKARAEHAALGNRDPLLKEALAFAPRLFEVGLAIVDAFDRARTAYHRAAQLERRPAARPAFTRALNESIRAIRDVEVQLQTLRRDLLTLTRRTGHTAYDAYALGEWRKAVARIPRLMRAAARVGDGLPHFEKLLYLPRCYHVSNLAQLRVQNTYHSWHKDPKGLRITPAGRP